jgi:hypothetical protein
MNSPVVFLAENFIYQDEDVRDVMLECLSDPVRKMFFDFLKAANIGLPKTCFISPELRRSFFSRERYLGAVGSIQKYLGKGEFLELEVAKQETVDNRLGIEALKLLDIHCNNPTLESLDELIYALDLLGRIQTFDVKKQIQEAYGLCYEIENSRQLSKSRKSVLARLIMRAKNLEARSAEYFFIEAVKKLIYRKNGLV